MSRHYKTNEPLSDDLIDKIIKRYDCAALNPQNTFDRPIPTATSRYVNVGLFFLRQVFFAKFDIKVHMDQGALYGIVAFEGSYVVL